MSRSSAFTWRGFKARARKIAFLPQRLQNAHDMAGPDLGAGNSGRRNVFENFSFSYSVQDDLGGGRYGEQRGICCIVQMRDDDARVRDVKRWGWTENCQEWALAGFDN